MSIQVEWDNDDKTLIRWLFVGHWTAQELRATIQKSNDLISAQDHPVNHIIDLSEAEGLPTSVINEIRNGMRQMPENVTHVVIIVQGGTLEAMSQALQRFSWFSGKIHVVRTNAEAQTYIASL